MPLNKETKLSLLCHSLWVFSHQLLTMLFQWSLLKSPGHFSVFCSSSAIPLFGWSRLVLLFLTHPANFTKPLGINPSAPTTICITITLIFHCLLLVFSFDSCEFSPPALADDFSQEFEWQQVSSSLQDFSHYYYYYYYHYYYYSLIRAFHISDSRWFFT